MQEAAQQERFIPLNLQFAVAVWAQDIHLGESFGEKDRTNRQPCNVFLSGERTLCDCMFHNPKNRGSFSAYNLHICCSISRQFRVKEITDALL